MAKGDVLVRMKADVSNYDANIAKARKTLDGFRQDNLTLSGIINQSTKSVVAAAAQYASFAAVIGTVAAGFSEAVSRGIELSREAEGVSQAFERLNKPGLLDNLRQATHNTVSDLELMKQAVKFDNFNLSLEQMGTFLAFAQQQAKDTGQDVNYLVDSIVTGLGRQSLPILDNLGLSASDIKERMKQTGDMTQAVAQIIQERMSKAGDYVETASDRAAQAQVKLDNAMKDLGDTMNSLTGAGATLWTDLKVGAIDLANTAIKPLIKLFSELAEYINGPTVESILTKGMTDVTDTVDDNGRLIRKDAISSIPEIIVSGTKPKKKKKKTGTTKTEVITKGDMNDLWLKMIGTADTLRNDDNRYFQSVHSIVGTKGANMAAGSIAPELSGEIEKQIALVEELRQKWAETKGEVSDGYLGQLLSAEDRLSMLKESQSISTGDGRKPYDLGKDISTQWTVDNKGQLVKKDEKNRERKEDRYNEKMLGEMSKMMGGVSGIFGGIEQMGIEIPGELKGVLNGINGLMTMVQSVVTVLEAIETLQTFDLFKFARGGIVPHAAMGMRVPGNDHTDNTPVLVSSGELILNSAQQNSVANALQGGGLRNLRLRTEISGRNLVVVIENDLAARGKGQLATFK